MFFFKILYGWNVNTKYNFFVCYLKKWWKKLLILELTSPFFVRNPSKFKKGLMMFNTSINIVIELQTVLSGNHCPMFNQVKLFLEIWEHRQIRVLRTLALLNKHNWRWFNPWTTLEHKYNLEIYVYDLRTKIKRKKLLGLLYVDVIANI